MAPQTRPPHELFAICVSWVASLAGMTKADTTATISPYRGSVLVQDLVQEKTGAHLRQGADSTCHPRSSSSQLILAAHPRSSSSQLILTAHPRSSSSQLIGFICLQAHSSQRMEHPPIDSAVLNLSPMDGPTAFEVYGETRDSAPIAAPSDEDRLAPTRATPAGLGGSRMTIVSLRLLGRLSRH